MGGVVLITPTGARPEQIQICARLMAQQTYTGAVTWVVVDDAVPRSTDFITDTFRDNWNIVKVYPEPPWQKGINTQARNLAAGLEAVNMAGVDAIFIIEDDDYYKPIYIEAMLERLKGYDLAGEQCTVYYNVVLRAWLRNLNYEWSSLFQTVFTPAVIPTFYDVINAKFIDCRLFPRIQRRNLFSGCDYGIGIKGLAGRGGIGMGHRDLASYLRDPRGEKLFELIGEDANIYMPYLRL